MPTQKDSLSEKLERIKKSAQQLPTISSRLNTVTDLLTHRINALDAVLKSFNLGVPVWVAFSSYGNPPFDEHDDVGYAKVNGRWGIAVRAVAPADPNRGAKAEYWLFNEAPRDLRVRAVDKIPELIEALIQNADKIGAAISSKYQEVEAMTAALNEVLSPAPAKPDKAK